MITPLESVRMSSFAYSEKLKEIRPWRLFKRIEIEETNAACSIYRNRNNVIVTFEGADSKRDLLVIMKFLKTKEVVGDIEFNAHAGFLKSYKSLHTEIVHTLNKIGKITHLHLTGHSMGGSLCDIAFLYLHDKYKNISIHTFAAARVTNSNAAKYIEANAAEYKRFVIKGDLVSKLPPRIFGYRHTSEEIKLDRITSKIISTHFYLAINNHSVLNYIKSIMIWTLEQQIIEEVEIKNEDIIEYE